VGGGASFFFVGVHIRCCGNGSLGFRPYGDSLFLQTPKKSKKKNACSYVRPTRWGSGFLRSGIHPGGIASGLLRCTSSRCVRLRRTVAALPPRMNPSSQPSDVARGSRSRAAAELTLILLSGEEQKRYAFCYCSSVGTSLLAKAVFQSTSKEQGNTRPLFARKPNPESAFKVHEPLRHKGYNTLRRCLRVRQNPPAYAAMGWAISFPCH